MPTYVYIYHQYSKEVTYKSDLENYQPISLRPAVCKLMVSKMKHTENIRNPFIDM